SPPRPPKCDSLSAQVPISPAGGRRLNLFGARVLAQPGGSLRDADRQLWRAASGPTGSSRGRQIAGYERAQSFEEGRRSVRVVLRPAVGLELQQTGCPYEGPQSWSDFTSRNSSKPK